MNAPQELKYTKSHEWIREEEGGIWTVGITDFAQDQLGSLVFINLPAEGDDTEAGEPFCDVESVKAASDVMAPVTGTVVEVNEELEDAPEKLNEDPYGAWIARIEGTPADDLMDADAYAAFCEEEG
ncbi:MAG: glycine cleavage system protein GcvH [Lachnospiraceae bacterium]|nr:glycine cleavage system protein GcvH [Lachnospiraceae bacterium]